MGLETLFIVGSIALSVALSAYSILSAPKGNSDGLQPQTLDQFNITMAREGSVVPLTYGKNKLAANIIFYDNLVTEEITTEVEGGKGFGGGGGEQTTGYKYFLDVWQAIAHGKLNIIKTYIQNEEKIVEASNTLFNDGTGSVFPTEPGALSNKIKGVAHVFYKRMFLGENVNTVPTIHFVVERILDNTINFANMASGNNPAAIIYDMLIKAGVAVNKINIGTFNAAASYWNSQGYGLNLLFDSQQKLPDMISKVFGFVDGIFYWDGNGQACIRALNPADATASVLDDDDFLEPPTLDRGTYAKVPNDFRANFIDEAQDFTQRTLTLKNEANLTILGGETIPQSLDLSAFRDISTASKRLFELMKRNSYPAAQINIKTNLGFSELLPGDVVSINSTELGISSAEFRIESIDQLDIDKNEIKFTASQMVETLFDDVFIVAGGTQYQPPNLATIALSKIRIFELPYNSLTGFEPAYLILAAREKLFETGFAVLYSQQSGANYTQKGFFTTFAQAGTLAAQYPSSTYAIDDTTGILYTPYKFDPGFNPQSRAQLFTQNRAAIIGNEIIAFQDIATEGANYRLKGCIRGVLNTPIETHNSGAAIYIVSFANNILRAIAGSNFYLKVVPNFQGRSFDASLVTPVNVVLQQKAKKPRKPSRLKANRTGSAVVLEIFPNTPDIPGYSSGSADVVVDVTDHPFPLNGDLQIIYDSTTLYVTNTLQNITRAGAFTINVRHRRFGLFSDNVALLVDAADGEYVI